MSNPNIIDVTHYSKRFQSDIVVQEDSVEEVIENCTDVPKNVTIEAAIAYFEAYAEGEFEALYARTAGWLKILLSTQNSSTSTKSREAIQALIRNKMKEKQGETPE